jgi:hypothetical protein
MAPAGGGLWAAGAAERSAPARRRRPGAPPVSIAAPQAQRDVGGPHATGIRARRAGLSARGSASWAPSRIRSWHAGSWYPSVCSVPLRPSARARPLLLPRERLNVPARSNHERWRVEHTQDASDALLQVNRVVLMGLLMARNAGEQKEMSSVSGVRRRAAAMRSNVSAEARMSRPCSSHVYQVTPTPAIAASSSRLRPSVLRRAVGDSPMDSGDNSRAPRHHEFPKLLPASRFVSHGHVSATSLLAHVIAQEHNA